MEWLEEIRIRTHETGPTDIRSFLREEGRKLKTVSGFRSARIYTGFQVVNEVCLHLYWEEGMLPSRGSDPGKRIAAVLAEWGLVSHATFKPIPD